MPTLSRVLLGVLFGLSVFVLYPGDSHATTQAEAAIQRSHAFLLLKDPQSALDEVNAALRTEPHCQSLLKTRIEILSFLGDASALMSAWRQYTQLFPQEASNRDLLETMGWGIIAKGARSPALATRAMALVGAHLGNDARGISILADGLRSSNALLRAISVEIAGTLRDDRLREEISRMLNEEKVWAVRHEAIRAAGRMAIKSATAQLEAIVSDPTSRAEDKAVAMQALTGLVDTADSEKIGDLVTSNRAGLRELACVIVAEQDDSPEVELLTPLLVDHHPKLRALALQAIAVSTPVSECPEPVLEHVRRCLTDSDPLTSLTAAWILSPLDSDHALAMSVFQRWLVDPSLDTQRMAAGILAATGPYGLVQMRRVVGSHPDGYVRANIGLGLLGLRDALPQACAALTTALHHLPERWMWREYGLFRSLCPSNVRQKEGTPNYPEIVNQIARLEILNALAMVHSPTALEAMKQFLQERTWGVVGIAASLLLAEGDASTFALIRELQKDPVKRVRAQAALVLALWGHDPESVATLQTLYKEADYALKGLILEALGAVGHETSISFLVKTLEEPSEQMRLIAASSLLRCLNH